MFIIFVDDIWLEILKNRLDVGLYGSAFRNVLSFSVPLFVHVCSGNSDCGNKSRYYGE